MIDTSDAAIEADLSRAESGGTPGVIAMLIGRAQIRATLQAARAAGRPSFQALPAEGGSLDIQIAQGPFGDSYAVPAGASWVDRVEAAARMLQVDPAILALRLEDADGTWEDRLESAAALLAVPPDVLRSLFARGGFEIPGGDPLAIEAPAELDVETDDDGSLEDAHTEDDLDEATVDEDFFADVKKARKR